MKGSRMVFLFPLVLLATCLPVFPGHLQKEACIFAASLCSSSTRGESWPVATGMEIPAVQPRFTASGPKPTVDE